MEFVTNNWLEIVNTIFVAIVALVLFSQKTRIKSLQDFVSIFDVEKLKQSTDYILAGEKSKHEVNIGEIQKKHESQLRSLNGQINELQVDLTKVKEDDNIEGTVSGLGFVLSKMIYYDLATISLTQTRILSFLQSASDSSDFTYDTVIISDFTDQFLGFVERSFEHYEKVVAVSKELDKDPKSSDDLISKYRAEYNILESEIETALSSYRKFESASGMDQH
jgi:hypothetical protein